MSLITLLSAPKPFVDPRVAMIQRNAVGAWSRLSGVEIVLMGDGTGIEEAAKAVGARHVGGVRTNDLGTPLISSMLDQARRVGGGELLCIINCDVLIMKDLIQAAELVSSRLKEFVLLGQRWDLDVEKDLDFSDGWEARLRMSVGAHGRRHRPAGSDYFIFPRACYHDVPDFAVGRAGWDNWMIYSARKNRMQVIDCTSSAMVVHQNHDYGHLPGGAPHYALPESDENIRLAGGNAAVRYTILDSTLYLESGKLRRPRPSGPRLIRSLELLLRSVFAFLPADRIEELARPKRWKRRLTRKHRGRSGQAARKSRRD